MSRPQPNIFDHIITMSQAHPWDLEIEDDLKRVAVEAKRRSEMHGEAAEWFKTLRFWCAAPLVIACFIMAPMCTMYASSSKMRMLEIWTFLICGVGQGLLFFGDFSGRAERNANFESRYVSICNDITETLAKPYRCRPLADVFVTRVKTAGILLTRNAPDATLFMAPFSHFGWSFERDARLQGPRLEM